MCAVMACRATHLLVLRKKMASLKQLPLPVAPSRECLTTQVTDTGSVIDLFECI